MGRDTGLPIPRTVRALTWRFGTGRPRSATVSAESGEHESATTKLFRSLGLTRFKYDGRRAEAASLAGYVGGGYFHYHSTEEESTMSWSSRYAIKSYLLSTVWIAPVIALALEQPTFRIAYTYQLHLGWVHGFAVGREGTVAIADYVISSSIAFIVFTFSSLIVAIQVASGQLTPRIIATALLRDNAMRGSVTVFVYGLLLAITEPELIRFPASL